MIIVSNTSPIINLAAIDQLNILQKLCYKIIIPEAVYHEIVVTGAGQPGSKEIPKLDWITTQKVSDKSLVKALQYELDDGEAEAIALAIELNSDLLLIDERIGRSVASRFNLKYIGLIGSLIEAKSKGIIQSIKPFLDNLQIKDRVDSLFHCGISSHACFHGQ